MLSICVMTERNTKETMTTKGDEEGIKKEIKEQHHEKQRKIDESTGTVKYKEEFNEEYDDDKHFFFLHSAV